MPSKLPSRMRRLWVYLLVLGALAGCSRCEREDAGPHHEKIRIQSTNYPQGDPNNWPFYSANRLKYFTLLGLPYNDFDTVIYSDIDKIRFFLASDTTWPEYEWRFYETKSVFTTKFVKLIYRQNFPDTVYLKVRDRARGLADSVKIGYRNEFMDYHPSVGKKYKGHLYFQGVEYENVETEMQYADPGGQLSSEQKIWLSGLFERACGVSKSTRNAICATSWGIVNSYAICPGYFENTGQHGLAFGEGGGCNIGNTNVSIDDGTPCLMKFGRNWIKVKSYIDKSVYNNNGGRPDSIVYYGTIY